MKLYENIKRRRIELGLSQSELASKVGYKDKGSISRIENGKIDLTQSAIEEFANALECTPSYLMGWTNDIQQSSMQSNVISAIDKMQKELSDLKNQDLALFLSNDEIAIIEQYRKANSETQKRIMRYINMELEE